MLPRRRDMVSKSVNNRIAVEANPDGFPINFCSDGKIRDVVSLRIERAELSGSRNKWTHVLCRSLQRSLLSEHSEFFDSATEKKSRPRYTKNVLHR